MIGALASDSRYKSWLAVVSLVALWAGWLTAQSLIAQGQTPTGEAAAQVSPPADPFAERGYAVTGGAAAGYVDDQLCGSCHADLYESYQDVAMAKSFYRPRADNDIEDFSQGYYHEPSRRHYRMTRRDGQLIMQRHQLDADGKPIHEVEQEVEWIMGSGNHSRTYLVRNPMGELYQLPLAWYSQTQSWGMAPGFDRPSHLGLSRRVRRECMFCHNAYPDVAEGSDTYNSPHVFPEELPQGLGCQRCHGPGAEHSRVAMSEEVDFKQLYSTIVNPGDLEPERLNDVCYQCHMQPTVAIPGTRRFGRPDYSFRPGQPLSDYLVGVDVVDAGQERGERFEINHHPYRLEQSRCFVASEGKMNCLTCHNPHRNVPVAEQAAHYRAVCLSCHEVDACQLESMADAADLPQVAADNCIACHMQERRPQDVVLVTMTDHLIRRRPGGPELVAPLEERDPDIEDVIFLDPSSEPEGALRDLYRAYAVTEVIGGHAVAVDKLEQLLSEMKLPEIAPYFALARGQLRQGRSEAARRTIEDVLARDPDFPGARRLLGMIMVRLGQSEAAIEQLLEAIDRGQDGPEVRAHLGALMIRGDKPAEAVKHLERVLEMRPNMHAAWFYIGIAQAELGRVDDAISSYKRALALEPTHSRAYISLARALLQKNRRDEAIRYLRHGVEHASQPEGIIAALKQIESQSSNGP